MSGPCKSEWQTDFMKLVAGQRSSRAFLDQCRTCMNAIERSLRDGDPSLVEAEEWLEQKGESDAKST